MMKCIRCGEEYGLLEIIYTCSKCGSTLEVISAQMFPGIFLNVENLLCGNIKSSCQLMNQR